MYKMIITNDDDEIFDQEVLPEEVITIMSNFIDKEDVEEEEVAPVEEKMPKKYNFKKHKKERKKTTCKSCGQEGHTKKTCGATFEPKVQAGKSGGDGKVMSLQHFETCRSCKLHDRDAEETAENLNIDLAEVKLAYKNTDYNEYCKDSRNSRARL